MAARSRLEVREVLGQGLVGVPNKRTRLTRRGIVTCRWTPRIASSRGRGKRTQLPCWRIDAPRRGGITG